MCNLSTKQTSSVSYRSTKSLTAYISNTGIKIDPSVINLDKPRHARKLDEGHQEKVEEVEFDFDGESTFKCEAEDSDDGFGNSDADWQKPVDESTPKIHGVDEDFKQEAADKSVIYNDIKPKDDQNDVKVEEVEFDNESDISDNPEVEDSNDSNYDSAEEHAPQEGRGHGEPSLGVNVSLVTESEHTEDENFKKYDSDNPIWGYFLRHKNREKAKCITCPNSIVSIRGGTTGSMRNHMKSKHKIRVGFKPITQRSISVELKPSIDKSWMDELEDENFKKYESDNPIWDYFLRDKNQEKAKCITCPDSILSIKNGNTGGMRNHMKLKHKIKVGLKPNAQNTYHDTHESVWIKKDHRVKDRIDPGPDPYKKNFNTREVDDSNDSNCDSAEEHAPQEGRGHGEPSVVVNVSLVTESEHTEDENFKEYYSNNPIWGHFLRHKNREKAKCITCHSILSIKGGNTGSMRAHMKIKHKIKVGFKPKAQNAYHNTEESVWIKKDHRIKDRINPGPDPYKKNFNTRVWKSFVWQYFTWLESGKATCNYCSKEFKTEEEKRLPMWISGLRW